MSNVVAIAGGHQFSLAVTTNGNVFAWGDNSHGQLGTNTNGGALSSPVRIVGMSNAVLVAASLIDPSGRDVYHSMAMTVDHGTNQYWGWGQNSSGQVGNGVNPLFDPNYDSNPDVYAPAVVQFCTRCERCVQLGTSGSFTAHCTGRLVLYFNDEVSQDTLTDNSGSFTVTVNGVTTNVPAFDGSAVSAGVVAGTVTNGGVYTYSASGLCVHDFFDPTTISDANGNKTNGVPWDCSSVNITNTICPAGKCFSLVGKIQ